MYDEIFRLWTDRVMRTVCYHHCRGCSSGSLSKALPYKQYHHIYRFDPDIDRDIVRKRTRARTNATAHSHSKVQFIDKMSLYPLTI